jgi:arylsulfatase A-like enzyme
MHQHKKENKSIRAPLLTAVKKNYPSLGAWVIGLALSFQNVIAQPAPVRTTAPPKPNILFIAVDDLRDWVGYLGHNPQVRTPNIDRLAKMGISFTHSYCAAPVCNASRAALMSGLRPGKTGVYDNNADWRTVIGENLMLTTTFRNAGYYVCGSGKIYHESFERPSEWDSYLTNSFREDPEARAAGRTRLPEGHSAGVGGIKFGPLECRDEDLPDWRIVSYGISELQKTHDHPFFLAVGLTKPHLPWNVPRKYFDLFPLNQIILPPYQEDDLADIPPAGVKMANPEWDHIGILKSGRWKEAVQAYLATIAYADMNIGRLLDAFEKSAYRDNTIICFWSDHGWHLGEKHHWRKFTLWEEGTRSPLIWIVPGVTKPGSVSERPVDLMSIYPTLTELCGLPTPNHVEGVSISALLRNPHSVWDRPAVTTFKFNNHAVRTEGWRYIRYANGGEELYNETKDPNEWTNVVSEPRNTALKTDLAKWLPTNNLPDLGRTQPGQKRHPDSE